MISISLASYGVPSSRSRSWNQTFGSAAPFFEPHGYSVWIRPLTNPHMYQPIPASAIGGTMASNRGLIVRAMHSVHRAGRSEVRAARLFALGVW